MNATLTDVLTIYEPGKPPRELVPPYAQAEFAALVASQPKLFRLRARVDGVPEIDYHDPMAGWRAVGIVSGIEATNAVGPTRVRTMAAAETLGIACDETD